jgi:hypothetical protein
MWMRTHDDPLPPRALAVNLSDRLRRFHAALAAVHLDRRFDGTPRKVAKKTSRQ